MKYIVGSVVIMCVLAILYYICKFPSVNDPALLFTESKLAYEKYGNSNKIELGLVGESIKALHPKFIFVKDFGLDIRIIGGGITDGSKGYFVIIRPEYYHNSGNEVCQVGSGIIEYCDE